MTSDAELVRATRRGDREAFAALVVRYERAAWASAWRVLRDDHEARDAAQEAFLLVYRRLAGLRDPSRFGPWLLRICRREAVRIARARRPAARIDDVDGEPIQPDGWGGLSPESEELLAAIAALPDHERLVVVLRYIEGHPVAAIARAIGRPVGTVTKQLSRAVDRLRLTLKEFIR
jgi:RNA polymerase sigma-70 factor (ECF subfamily)